MPLGVIRNKRNSSKKQSRISRTKMLKGVVEIATKFANESILNNKKFIDRFTLDPVVSTVQDFDMEPFKSGWARRKERGNIYGESYISMYENELKEMFFMGLEYSNLKMSAGKMRENLKKSHPECFSIPGETEIKQFINKMSEQQKRIATNKDKVKSNRGRKPGSAKSTWHEKLKEILEKNLKEKPRTIYDEFIKSYNGNYPSDLPMMKGTNEPDGAKIKSALQRFKRSIESKVRKELLM